MGTGAARLRSGAAVRHGAARALVRHLGLDHLVQARTDGWKSTAGGLLSGRLPRKLWLLNTGRRPRAKATVDVKRVRLTAAGVRGVKGTPASSRCGFDVGQQAIGLEQPVELRARRRPHKFSRDTTGRRRRRGRPGLREPHCGADASPLDDGISKMCTLNRACKRLSWPPRAAAASADRGPPSIPEFHQVQKKYGKPTRKQAMDVLDTSEVFITAIRTRGRWDGHRAQCLREHRPDGPHLAVAAVRRGSPPPVRASSRTASRVRTGSVL